jgi:hypothetical protein
MAAESHAAPVSVGRARVAFVSALLASSACTAPAAQPDVPARIVDPTPASRAALVQAVAEALNGASVTLADDALTTESLLIIERAASHDPSGRQPDGRDLGRPWRFHLVQRGSQCVLVSESDGRRRVLRSTRCIPE